MASLVVDKRRVLNTQKGYVTAPVPKYYAACLQGRRVGDLCLELEFVMMIGMVMACSRGGVSRFPAGAVIFQKRQRALLLPSLQRIDKSTARRRCRIVPPMRFYCESSMEKALELSKIVIDDVENANFALRQSEYCSLLIGGHRAGPAHAGRMHARIVDNLAQYHHHRPSVWLTGKTSPCLGTCPQMLLKHVSQLYGRTCRVVSTALASVETSWDLGVAGAIDPCL